ncbi:hypothetical protein GCK72_025441 [Caenorhabditis remanei]|uniref:Uncharacterized protein n=1 Tax=Caenorhabditis remanei TaxID=31234 RepID=A0A6A5G2W4_CAERE|nr:hypothetical protein GCK72_025441 [Caenorhabditis remanei]KAF1748974.1 hypothetical protein GCK72_025441 [Caenorhabditis remanei]
MSSSDLSTRSPPSSQGDLFLTIYVCGENPEDLRNFIPIHIFTKSITELEDSVDLSTINYRSYLSAIEKYWVLRTRPCTIWMAAGLFMLSLESVTCCTSVLQASEESIRNASQFAQDWENSVARKLPQALSIRSEAAVRIANVAKTYSDNDKAVVFNETFRAKVATGAKKKVSLNDILSKFKNWGNISQVCNENCQCDTSDDSINVIEDNISSSTRQQAPPPIDHQRLLKSFNLHILSESFLSSHLIP